VLEGNMRDLVVSMPASRIPHRGVAFALALALCACTYKLERGGAAVATGALRASEARLAQIDPEIVAPLAEAGARATVDGALRALEEDDTQRRLEQAVRVAAAAVVRGIVEGEREMLVAFSDDIAARVIRTIATGFEGPLRTSIADTTRVVSASAVKGARDELTLMFPECVDGDRQRCVERRITELSRAASFGAARGVTAGLRPLLLALSFVAGVGLTLLAVLVMQRRRPRSVARVQ
jgi:hypothetical protein